MVGIISMLVDIDSSAMNQNTITYYAKTRKYTVLAQHLITCIQLKMYVILYFIIFDFSDLSDPNAWVSPSAYPFT